MLKHKHIKYAVLFAIQFIIVLALLPGCFQTDTCVYSLVGEDIVGQEAGSAGYWEIRGEYMNLSPGVYQVRVWSNLSDSQNISVSVECEDKSFKAICSNVATVFSGDEYIDFEVYVSDKISTAYVVCGFNNADATSLVQLDVYKTSLGNRMLLFIVIVCFAVLDFMVYFRKRILDGKVTKQQQVVFWILVGGVILSYIPFMTDYIFSGHDTLFHLSRVAFLKDSLLLGEQFPVRVQSTWLCDHGYAVSLFYGELFLYIPSLLMIVGFPLMTAYKIFIFVVMACTAIISYNCFKVCVKNKYAALFGSMIYILAPYRLLDVYGRGALGEFLAMTFLPLICAGMYLLYTEEVTSVNYSKYKWYIIGGISALLQCHILSMELVVVFMAVVCVVCWKRTLRKKTFGQLLQAVGLVLLINAWFLIPFLYMLGTDSYNISKVTDIDLNACGLTVCEFFQFIPQNAGLPLDFEGHVPAQIGIGAIILLIIYCFWHLKTRAGSKSCTVMAGLTMLALLLCMGFFPWEALAEIPVIGFAISSIQFPWRFMSLASVCVAMFATFFYAQVSERGGGFIKIAVGIAGVAALISAVYYANSVVYEENAIYLYEEENIGTAAVIGAEYLLLGDTADMYYYHSPVADEGLEWSCYEKNGTNVDIMLSNCTNETRYIEIPLIGYKGYQLEGEITGEMPYITEDRGNHGDLRIAVPAGYRGSVHISYKGFVWFRLSEMISLVTVLVVLGSFFYKKREKSVQNEV